MLNIYEQALTKSDGLRVVFTGVQGVWGIQASSSSKLQSIILYLYIAYVVC